ncbi:autotransporter-associated beta strand repeat protein [Chthoniobacter flavus Ellin428]|uniref:Autotransporter-associated beta strand repeat protein n=1 Tax=Chthoniobacter flavus Ellin428 TaxID=497964 RepID=B4DC36_9BACT|nr:autotransporter-associated beta strand repeat-containing protein [Chthoniobacter flavus]EDY16010.1 autotransporter-associated beta strand repeat protein [Chthoniobacter flavus Ellin428]TCO85268.1 putative secreted protein with PEP-CTERM sorting signal [Chthoniobacter flavus]
MLTAALGKAATTGTWSANASGLWSNSANWSSGTIPGSAAGDIANLTFNITTNVTVTLDTSRTLGTLNIGDTTTQSNSYTLASGSGSTLTFDNGVSAAALTQNSTSNGDTISAAMLLNSALNINDNNATKSLTLSGTIGAGTTGTKIITITGSAVGGVVISGSIGAGSGDVSIVKNNGNNTLTLSGNNTFTGGVTLNLGTLALNNAGALGATASALTITGGTVTGTATIGNGNAENWNGDFTFGGSGNFGTGTGAVTINANRKVTIGGTGTYTVGGAIGQSTSGLALTVANGASNFITGTLVLGGANTYTGGTNITGGLVQFLNASAIPASGSIVVGSGGAVSVSGVYTTLAGWLGESHLSTTSTGALALIADSSENFDPGTPGYGALSLGAGVGKTVNYTGTITPASGVYRVGGGGGALNLNNTNAITGGNSLVTGNGGGGTVVLAQSNDYSGTTTVASGILQVGNGSTTGSISNTSSVVANGALAFNHSDTVTFGTAVSGTGGIAQAGTGVLIINGTSNTYATTSINRGTLRLGATNALPTASALNIGSGATAGTFDTSTFDQTVGSVNFLSTSSTVTNTVTIPAGQTLTVNGAYTVGLANQSGITTKAIMSGGGALTVNNTAANFEVGVANADQNTAANFASLDITALSALSANVNEFGVGFGSQIGSTLLLSNTSNTITASTLQISNSNGNNAQTCVMTLGTGTNVLNINTINLGVSKGVGTLKFASQTAGSSGTVVIGGKSGGATNFVLANSNGSGTAGNLVGLLDLRGHNSTVTAGTVTLASRDTGSGSCTGTIDFDTGTFTVNTLVLATKTSSGTNVASGTLNLSGGSFTVNPGGSFTMATQSGTGTASGTLNITGGVFMSNADILDGGGVTAAAAASTINLNGGTLDLTGHNIGNATNSVDTLAFGSGTLRNVGQINNGAGLTKSAGTGANTLTLAGTNNYTGATNVTSGTLLVSGTLTGTTSVVVASGATLGGDGTIGTTGTTVNVNAGGTLAPGTGLAQLNIGTGGTGNSVIFDGTSSASRAVLSIEIDANSSASDTLAIDGNLDLSSGFDDLTLTILNGSTPTGIYTIATYTGTLTGTFDNVNLPAGYSLNYGSGTDSEITLTNIPEPASWAVLLSGVLGLAGLRRRRR